MNGRKLGKSHTCCLCKYCAPSGGKGRMRIKKWVRRLQRRLMKKEVNLAP